MRACGLRDQVIEAGIRHCPGVSVAVKIQWPLHDCGTTPAGDQWPQQCRDPKCCMQFQEKMEREVRAMQLFRSERSIQLLDYGVGPIAEQLGSGMTTYARIRPYGPANKDAVAYSMMTAREHAVLGEVAESACAHSYFGR